MAHRPDLMFYDKRKRNKILTYDRNTREKGGSFEEFRRGVAPTLINSLKEFFKLKKYASSSNCVNTRDPTPALRSLSVSPSCPPRRRRRPAGPRAAPRHASAVNNFTTPKNLRERAKKHAKNRHFTKKGLGPRALPSGSDWLLPHGLRRMALTKTTRCKALPLACIPPEVTGRNLSLYRQVPKMVPPGETI